MLDFIEKIGKGLDVIIHKLSVIILIILTTCILLFAWSTNHYIKELLKTEADRNTASSKRLSIVYSEIFGVINEYRDLEKSINQNLTDLKSIIEVNKNLTADLVESRDKNFEHYSTEIGIIKEKLNTIAPNLE